MPKKISLFFLVPIFVGIVAFTWWKSNIKPVSSNSTVRRFIIPKGSSAMQVANKLGREELIRSPLAFKIYVQATGKAKKIQAGEYDLSVDLNLFEVVTQLLSGPHEVWVTIPEGLRREEVVEKFIAGLEKNGQEVVDFREEFLGLTKGEEGTLFPDTYLFPKTAPASAVVNMMISTFNKRVDSQMMADIDQSGRTINEILTMASILERETVTDEERPVVAGILYKRLDNSWPLQADATVQYAVSSAKCKVQSVKCDEWWPIITNEDLEIKSSYNTYKYSGLPPASIANPGLSSIEAATYPQDSAYWFYLHDEKGVIHYAETIEEHNRNIARYLK